MVGSEFLLISIGLPTTTCIGCLYGKGDLKGRGRYQCSERISKYQEISNSLAKLKTPYATTTATPFI